MRISDWSSDVCSSDLLARLVLARRDRVDRQRAQVVVGAGFQRRGVGRGLGPAQRFQAAPEAAFLGGRLGVHAGFSIDAGSWVFSSSEEHTAELQSHIRNSYAVFCLYKKKETTSRTYL